MQNLIRDAWDGTADVFAALGESAADAILTLYAAMCALPLPVAVLACAAGAALFHAIDQRAQRRDR